MIVDGGKSFLNTQSQAKKKTRDKEDSKSFQDLLSGAQRKKKAPAKKRMATKSSEKVKAKDHDVDDSQSPQKQPVKNQPKKMANTSGKKEMNGVKETATAQQPMVMAKRPVQNQEIEKATIAEVGTDAIHQDLKKMTTGVEKAVDTASSLNSSEIKNQTLAKSEKILKNLESQFNEVMKKVAQEKPALAQQQVQQMQAASPVTAPKINGSIAGVNKSEGLKIPSEMILSEGGETLASTSAKPNQMVAGLEKSLEKESGDQFSSQMEALLGQQLDTENANDVNQGTQFIEEMQQTDKPQKIENIQSIIKQARAVVDDGGGTMEIHLQPEGLGKVHLKVAVQDGQVNVEMMADNMAAKRALEDGLVDIKNALEGQKLLVETMKVEMSQDYQKDFSDLQQHMQEQANRDFAEQFLGQMKQEREERFGGMFDSFRNFQRPNQEPELSLRNRTFHESGKGRSVNLVA